MTDDLPNYQRLSPPPEKEPTEYTYVERRAELYDLIDQQGGHRNLNRTQRELGNRYGVSHTTIRKDIERILEWQAEHLGEYTESELSILQGRAIQDYMQAAKEHRDKGRHEEAAECMAKAYDVGSTHLDDLLEVGAKNRPADKHELTGPDGGPIEKETTHAADLEDEDYEFLNQVFGDES